MAEQKRQPTEHEKLLEDYYLTFAATDHGRRVLADLKRRCGWGQSTFGTDAHRTAYLAGRQDVPNEIVQLLNERRDQSHE